jgi:hypothetical protein
MPTTYAIPNGATQFAATTYTGNGSTQSITNGASTSGVSFQPDLVWIKGRSGATNNGLQDSVRGTAGGILISNSTAAESAGGAYVSSLDANGFTVNNNTSGNNNASTYVGWQWKAGGTAVSNTAGSITSQVSANPSAGFSIVTFTCPASGNFTVGHGLGIAPAMYIVKSRSSAATNWGVYHKNMNATPQAYFMQLNTTVAATNSTTAWANTAPTSSVFSMGTNSICNPSDTAVAYCFSEIAGFSKFGSYTGNGSADGTFVYLGFRPAFVLLKNASATGQWHNMDYQRTSASNVVNGQLYANLSNAEAVGATLDFLSNGFKIRTNSADINGSTNTIIYAAFAENPFKFSLAR